MLYVEVLKKRYNNVGRTFCDAINPEAESCGRVISGSIRRLLPVALLPGLVELFIEGDLFGQGELFPTADTALQAEPEAVIRAPLAHTEIRAGMFGDLLLDHTTILTQA